MNQDAAFIRSDTGVTVAMLRHANVFLLVLEMDRDCNSRFAPAAH